MEKQRARQTLQTQGGRVGDKNFRPARSPNPQLAIPQWQPAAPPQLSILFQRPPFFLTNFKTWRMTVTPCRLKVLTLICCRILLDRAESAHSWPYPPTA